MAVEGSASRGTWTEAFHQYQSDILTKIRKGQTEESIPIGAGEYTQTEWQKVMKSVDKQIEDIRKEQELRQEKRQDRLEARRVYEAAVSGSGSPAKNLREAGRVKVPYGNLAKDGVIEYNGVTFVCDERTNSICLGDVSDTKNTLVIPLAEGGCLKVNRDNLGDLQRAIGMFSPEDVNRILRAIAKDNKARQMREELEEDKASVTEMGADNAKQADAQKREDGK